MIEWLALLQWRQPAWLLMLPLPVAAILAIRHRPKRRRLAAFINPALWHWLIVKSHRPGIHSWPLTLLAAWGLACLAAAGPVIKGNETIERGYPAVNIAVIMDISPSMAVTDTPPSRLSQARLQLRNFVEELSAARLALIAFSANAYTVLPLTVDRTAFNHFLESLDPGLVSISGSNLTRALELADQALSQTGGNQPPPGGLVLLISDGEIHDRGATAAARTLAQHGHRLYILGTGTEPGGPVPSHTGRLISHEMNLVVSKRDRATLQALANAGSGTYADLGPDGWQTVTATANALQRQHPDTDPMPGDIPLFPWLLATALALMIWHSLRHPQTLALWLLLPTIGAMGTADAAPWQEAAGLKQLSQHNYKESIKIYSELNNYAGHLGYGVAAYKLSRWDEAEAAFHRAAQLAGNHRQRAKATYNLGNALARLNKLDDAADAYRAALRWQPDHANAIHNLALLDRHRRDNQATASPPPEPTNPGDNADPTGHPDGEPDDQGLDAGNSDNGAAAGHHALQATLELWRRLPDGEPPPQRLLQQLDRLEEDTTTFLQHRFAREDRATIGGTMEKPW